MLWSKTKIFKSVLVIILALSMIGGLVMFKGFAVDEVNDSLETPGVVIEESERVENLEPSEVSENISLQETEESEKNLSANEDGTATCEDSRESATDLNIEEKTEVPEVSIEALESHICLPGECPENPIIINSVDDLEDFATALETGNDFSGKYFEIKNDITVSKDDKFFAERLKQNGWLFTGEFNGYMTSSEGSLLCFYVDEIPEKVTLFEKLGENADVYINLILSSAEEVGVYTFSSLLKCE